MVFSSLTFLLIFLPLLYILYFAGCAPRWRNGVLLAMSLLFYGWGEPLWILAMLISTFANFYCARALTRTDSEPRRRAIRRPWRYSGKSAATSATWLPPSSTPTIPKCSCWAAGFPGRSPISRTVWKPASNRFSSIPKL